MNDWYTIPNNIKRLSGNGSIPDSLFKLNLVWSVSEPSAVHAEADAAGALVWLYDDCDRLVRIPLETVGFA